MCVYIQIYAHIKHIYHYHDHCKDRKSSNNNNNNNSKKKTLTFCLIVDNLYNSDRVSQNLFYIYKTKFF